MFSLIQMFSRIAEALRRTNAVTLEQLRSVIHNSYTPSPASIYRENIFDIKSWLRPYTATFKHHSNPHAFRFKLNEHGEVEMTYRNWAMADKKEWLPDDGPFIVLEELPEGNPPLQRPDNSRCPTTDSMEGSLKHASVRMKPEEIAWWRKFVDEEKQRRKQWDEMTNDDYNEAGTYFDLMAMANLNPVTVNDDRQDEAYKKRDKELRELIIKKNNFPPVSKYDCKANCI